MLIGTNFCSYVCKVHWGHVFVHSIFFGQVAVGKAVGQEQAIYICMNMGLYSNAVITLTSKLNHRASTCFAEMKSVILRTYMSEMTYKRTQAYP